MERLKRGGKAESFRSTYRRHRSAGMVTKEASHENERKRTQPNREEGLTKTKEKEGKIEQNGET